MSDIIRLLPDHIANQIAAGEVIQRPASVVKELLENAIDAGASRITLIVKDAGKTLIQVVDNGSGMTATDARLAFERHATSKISKADDLFAIKTMGFRGEALASIASIAQVKLSTCRKGESIGTQINLEASEVNNQEPAAVPEGSRIEVRNIFYNVPARRKFLKSDTVEMRYILEEFQRVAIAHPSVAFKLINNDKEQYNLPKAALRQRIVNVLGNRTGEIWIPLKEEIDGFTISGYVSKPEAARKSKADQYFFINGRFFKSGYLHHAVMNAYQELIQDGTHPPYVIFFEADPATIDVNVHPTKQEIKFEDDRMVYSYLRVTVRHALGQYALTPMLDFENDHAVASWLETKLVPQSGNLPEITTEHSRLNQSGSNPAPAFQKDRVPSNWRDLYETAQPESRHPSMDAFGTDNNNGAGSADTATETMLQSDSGNKEPYQIHKSYIISQIKSGFILVDQQRAHLRILYERFLDRLHRADAVTQNLLFPEKIELNPKEALLLEDIMDLLTEAGFDIHSLGHGTFMIYGVPLLAGQLSGYQEMISGILASFGETFNLKLGNKERIALSMARSAGIRRGDALSSAEMSTIIDQLFACEMPYSTPVGKNCFITFDLNQLVQQFA